MQPEHEPQCSQSMNPTLIQDSTPRVNPAPYTGLEPPLECTTGPGMHLWVRNVAAWRFAALFGAVGSGLIMSVPSIGADHVGPFHRG